jgi:GNAT superfamily N-acetyltransferase
MVSHLRWCLFGLCIKASRGCFVQGTTGSIPSPTIPWSLSRITIGKNRYQTSLSGTDQSTTMTLTNNNESPPPPTATSIVDEKGNDAYTIRILTPDDQETIWKMLMYASHDTSVESVQSQHPTLTQYAASFGTHEKDFGVVAVLHSSSRSDNATATATTTATMTADDSVDQQTMAIGAAWVRLLPNGYAFVDGETPELAIAVEPEMRSRGIGFHLLRTLLEKLRDAATTTAPETTATTMPIVPAVSLSCRLENHAAIKVYERLGFVTIPSSLRTNPRSGGQSVSMVCRWDDGVVIRQAQPHDVDVVLELIKKKSEFDQSIGAFEGELQVTKERLLETVLLNQPKISSSSQGGGGPPYAQMWLAERLDPSSNGATTAAVDGCDGAMKTNRTTVGLACFHFRYSSFVGRPSIWLDDLFVESTGRSQGVGTAIMSDLALFATNVHNATHIGWTADARNVRGLSFYQRLGATIVEKQDNRCILQWKTSSPPPKVAEAAPKTQDAGSSE